MERTTIGCLAVDIDGVLADLISAFLPLLNQRFGRQLSARDITRYAFEEVAQVSAAEMDAFMWSLVPTGFYQELPPVPGAPEALRQLAERYHVHLITSRPAELAVQTEAWLAKHGIPYHQLSFRRRPHKLLPEDRADVVVEDDAEAALHAAAIAPRVFLLDYPYNRQGVTLPPHCLRVQSWSEIVAALLAPRA